MGDLILKGVQWIQEYVIVVNLDNNEVVFKDGIKVFYDYLVACLGVKYDYLQIEGLEEIMNKNQVCSNYVDLDYIWEVFQEFKGGNVIFI